MSMPPPIVFVTSAMDRAIHRTFFAGLWCISPCGFDVVAKLDDARLFGREDRAHFVQRPGEIIAVVVERLVGVLARVKSAARLVREHGIRPIDDAFGDFAKKRIARDLIAVQKILQQFRIVVRHFLEMRHAPALVHRIAMEPAGHLVVDASGAHFLERDRGHFQHPRAAARLVAFEQQIDRRGMREFRRAAKSSVARIKQIHDGFGLILRHARIELSPPARKRFRIRHRFGKAGRGLFHFGAPIAKSRGDGFENAAEARAGPWRLPEENRCRRKTGARQAAEIR